MSENNFLKIIKDTGLSHEDVLKILEKEGKIKDPKTYAEIYKVEEAKRLAKEKAEKEKAEKEKGTPTKPTTPPAEPPAETPTEPPAPPAEPKTALDKRLDEFEAKITKLIAEGSRVPLATPSTGVESEKKKEGDFSLGLEGKYEKYV